MVAAFMHCVALSKNLGIKVKPKVEVQLCTCFAKSCTYFFLMRRTGMFLDKQLPLPGSSFPRDVHCMALVILIIHVLQAFLQKTDVPQDRLLSEMDGHACFLARSVVIRPFPSRREGEREIYIIKALSCALPRRVVLFQVTGKRADLARFLEQGLKKTLQLDRGLTQDQSRQFN